MTARIIQFPGQGASKHGFRRARRKKRVNLEDFGQLNLFDSEKEAKVISFSDEIRPFEKALELEEQGLNEKALEYYEKAARQNQQRADAYCNMGIIVTELGRIEDAMNYFTQALADNPRHLEAHYNLGNLYADVGNLKLARIHYEMAIQVDPSFASTYYNLALLHMDSGELKKAEERLMQYRSIAEENEKVNATVLLNEIRNHLNIGNYE